MKRKHYERVLRRLVDMARRFQKDVLAEKQKHKVEGPGSFHFDEFLKARSSRWAYMHAARLLKDEWDEAQEEKQRADRIRKIRSGALVYKGGQWLSRREAEARKEAA